MICGIDGNPDLYGIGVRVGLYLQWTSTFLTTLYAHENEDNSRITNLLIQSGIFGGTLFLTGRQKIHAEEVVISTWLIFGALSSLSGNGNNPIDRFSGIFRVSLYTAVAAYASWFWFTGLDGILRAKPGCTPVAFFGKTSISGPFRTFNKVASVLGLVICTGFLGWSMHALFQRWKVGKRARAPGRPTVRAEFCLLSVSIIVFSIIAVEYLVRANAIRGLHDMLSVGQMIPLLVGSFSLLEVLIETLREQRFRDPRCWLVFGHHL